MGEDSTFLDLLRILIIILAPIIILVGTASLISPSVLEVGAQAELDALQATMAAPAYNKWLKTQKQRYGALSRQVPAAQYGENSSDGDANSVGNRVGNFLAGIDNAIARAAHRGIYEVIWLDWPRAIRWAPGFPVALLLFVGFISDGVYQRRSNSGRMFVPKMQTLIVGDWCVFLGSISLIFVLMSPFFVFSWIPVIGWSLLGFGINRHISIPPAAI